MFGKGKFVVENDLECLGSKYFIRNCNVSEYKRWAINRTLVQTEKYVNRGTYERVKFNDESKSMN